MAFRALKSNEHLPNFDVESSTMNGIPVFNQTFPTMQGIGTVMPPCVPPLAGIGSPQVWNASHLRLQNIELHKHAQRHHSLCWTKLWVPNGLICLVFWMTPTLVNRMELVCILYTTTNTCMCICRYIIHYACMPICKSIMFCTCERTFEHT